ncbi:Transcription factor BYE1 [Talaromyces islandicus]|uniref:Transcription factor BYE1 n=1 Tax=Talaromyces islandicus TaxID=28573 RepID=A0A0U1LN46_TALIS|nr:Transcription factor BYE1 [Talaromyces islandicus]
MADEPRRSGRATKGQHKNLELVQDMPSKKSKTKGQGKDRSSKQSTEPTPAPSEEEEEFIRCICGKYEEEEDIERDMICCDSCSAWQHNDCMGLSFEKGAAPDEYYCEKCKPEDHKVLLEKMSRGEKPWEEVAQRRQQEIEEKKAAKRKKGKKGKRGGARPSDVKSQQSAPSTPAPGPTSPTPTKENSVTATSQTATEHQTSPAPALVSAADESKPPSTQKRKFEEPSASDAGPKSKQQKLSEPNKLVEKAKKSSPAHSRKTSSAEPNSRKASVTEKLPVDLVEKPEDIDSEPRKKVAIHLVNLFLDQVAVAQKQGAYKLPADKQAEDVARPLGLAIEHAMYMNICGGSGDPNDTYRNQLRTIMFNVKKNPVLRNCLLTGTLAPTILATMSSQDMASEEQQQKDAEIKREAEKQHIIMQEQGPRIRRTHKGEEVIEGDGQAGTSESIFSSTAVHRAAAEVENASPHSPSGPGSVKPRSHESNVDQDRKFAGGKGSGPNGSHSPGMTNQDHMFPEVSPQLHQPPPPGGRVQADEEIDELLKDEGTESPPYSPKDFHGSDVWRGRISMNSLADFGSTAKHVGGADLSAKIPWSQLMPPNLVVDGRISIELASKYLCGLRFSNSTDVSVVAIPAPDSASERAEFGKLFNYFTDRQRYGVVGQHPIAAVKDTYLIPIEAGASQKPEFLQLLENNSIEDPTPDQMFLVVFVVKSDDHPPSEKPTPYHESPLNSTPFTQHHPQYASPSPALRQASQAPTPMNAAAPESSIGNTGSLHHPLPQQGHGNAYPPLQQQQAHAQPHSPQVPLTGAAAAAYVLGPQAKSPAIVELLQKAPSADVAQLNIVREIISKNPSAANDYASLMNAIQQYTSPGQQNGQPGPRA